jgi:hypothetical protein
MARKRKKLKGLDYQSAEYWNRLLIEEGLSMEAGTSRRITYVGDSNVLDRIAGEANTGSRDSSFAKDVTYKPELPENTS